MLIKSLLILKVVKIKINIFINIVFNININFINFKGGQDKNKYFYKYCLQY